MDTPNAATGPTAPSFVVRRPLDLVALAPVVLGFRPVESVVLETFGGPVGPFHARGDLPHGHDDQDVLAARLVAAALRNGAACAAVVVFSAHPGPARRQGRVLRELLREAGVDVIDALVADGSCFGGVDDAGVGTPYDLDAHPFLAQRVFDGALVHESRAAVSATLVGGDPEDRAAVAEVATGTDPHSLGPEAVHAEALWMQGRIRRFHRTGAGLTAVEAGRMLALCGLPSLRDVAWAELSREHGAADVALWRDLLRRAPDGLVARAAGLLAFAAWLHGDGALAWCAIERARVAGGEDELAGMVSVALTEAIPPHSWEPFRAEEAGR